MGCLPSHVCLFAPYISAMAGSMQARMRASLHADLQSAIHWEMKDCLTDGCCLSPSTPLSTGFPFLASNLAKLCFGEMFGIEVLVLVCNSGQLLLRWRGKAGLDSWGMLWDLEPTWRFHMLPCCLINLPSTSVFVISPERLLWCP